MRNSLLTQLRSLFFTVLTAGALWSCQDEKPEIILPDPIPDIPQKEFRYLESLTPDTVKFKKLKEQDSIIFNIRTIPYDLLSRDSATIIVADTAGMKYQYAEIKSYTLRKDSVWNIKTYINKGVKSGDVISLMLSIGDTAMFSDPVVLYLVPKEPRAIETLNTDSLIFDQVDSAVIRIKTLPLNLLSLDSVKIEVTDIDGELCEAARISSISLVDSVWNLTTRIKYPIKTGDIIRLRITDEDTVMYSRRLAIKIIPKPEPTRYSIMITSDSVAGFLDGGQATIRLKTSPWNVLFNDTTFILALRDTSGTATDKLKIAQKEFVPDDSCWRVKIDILDNTLSNAAVMAHLTCPDTVVSSQSVNIRKVAISMKSIKFGNDLTMKFDSTRNAYTCRVAYSNDLKNAQFLFDHDGDRIMIGDTLLTEGQYNTLDASKPFTVTVWKYDVCVDFNLELSFLYRISILSDNISAYLKGGNQATIRLKTEPWNVINNNSNALTLATQDGQSIDKRFTIASKEFQQADSSWIVKVKIVNTNLTDDYLTAKLTCPDTVILSTVVNIKQVNPVMANVLTGNDIKMNFDKPTSTFHYFYYQTNNAPATDYANQRFKFTYSNGDKITVDGKTLTDNQYNKIDMTKPVTVSVWKYDVHRDYVIRINTGLPVVRITGAQSMTSGYDRVNWIGGATMTIEEPDGTISYTGSLSLKGRGNGTWTDFNKKPFAIKLDEKAKILGMHKQKRWILLANFKDRTLLRNDAAFWISRNTDMPYTIDGQFVELIWNGEYKGNYYLCEQARIDNHRIDINNPDLEDPEKGGFFMEIDAFLNTPEAAGKGEDLGFFSEGANNRYKLPYIFKDPDEDEQGNLLTTSSPSYIYMKNYVKNMEDAIYNASSTNHSWMNYLDIDRAVDFALIQEITMNHDAYNTWPKNGPHSAFLYKDSCGLICFGPMWDFDYHTFTLYGDFQYSGSWNDEENARLRQWEILKLDSKTSSGKYYFSDLASRDPQFKSRLVQRWNQYKTVWKDSLPAYIDQMADKIRVSEYYNEKKWGYPNKQNGDNDLDKSGNQDFQKAIDAMKKAFLIRWDWIDKNIGKL